MNIARTAVLVLVVLALVVLLSALLPAPRIEASRSVHLDRPPSTVYALLNGFHGFNRWSPWIELDPEARFEYDGPPFGAGATMRWHSDHPGLGSGARSITDSVPFEHIVMSEDLGNNGVGESRFTIEPSDGGVRLTWAFDLTLGRGPIARISAGRLESRLARTLETGLERFRALAESFPGDDWADLAVTITERDAEPILLVPGLSAADIPSIGRLLEDAFQQIARVMQRHGLTQNGAPLAFARSWGESGFTLDAGIPYSGSINERDLEHSPVQRAATPPGRVVQAVHTGRYGSIPDTYRKLMVFLAVHGFEPAGDPWESYVSDPAATAPDDMVTVISYPIRDSAIK